MNHKLYRVLGTGLLLSFSTSVMAQSAKTLSMTEAIDLGVKNSKQLKQSGAQIAIAKASLREMKDRRLPNASISGSYLRVSKPTLALLYNQNTTDNNSGSGSTSGTSTSPQVKEAMYALGNVSYTLFDGFKNAAAIKSAKYLQAASELDAETDKQQVVLNIIAAYSNLYKANNSVLLVKKNLKQSKLRTKDFENLEKNGLIARNDLLKAKLQESNIQLSLLDAESDAKVANLNMDLLLGLPEETILELDSSYFQKINEAKSLLYWEQQALEKRSDYQSLGMRMNAAKANIRSAKGGYYPSLSLTGGYVALNVPGAIKVSDAWNGGIGLKYNIASLWKTGAEINAAKAQLIQTEAARDMMSDNIRVQLYQAYESYLVSIKKIEVLSDAFAQATENYKIIKNKYDNSLSTTTDLLDADVQQLQAELNYSYAKADAILAYNKLLQVSGVLAI